MDTWPAGGDVDVPGARGQGSPAGFSTGQRLSRPCSLVRPSSLVTSGPGTGSWHVLWMFPQPSPPARPGVPLRAAQPSPSSVLCPLGGSQISDHVMF